MKNKKGILVGFVIIIFLILIITILSIFIGIHIITTQNGTHTGFITAIEENGIIFKTIAVYFKTDSESSQEDIYCLIDRNLIPALQEKQTNKEMVTITFYDYLLPSITECGIGDGIISGVN